INASKPVRRNLDGFLISACSSGRRRVAAGRSAGAVGSSSDHRGFCILGIDSGEPESRFGLGIHGRSWLETFWPRRDAYRPGSALCRDSVEGKSNPDKTEFPHEASPAPPPPDRFRVWRRLHGESLGSSASESLRHGRSPPAYGTVPTRFHLLRDDRPGATP